MQLEQALEAYDLYFMEMERLPGRDDRSPIFNPVERVMSRPLATARRVGTTTPVRSTVVVVHGSKSG
jgi:hypothetical protein